jgi:RNA polymerase sigma-70 factor (ECF subfamily)
MDYGDGEVLGRARLGEEDALRAIVERYEHQVAATVTGILGNGPEVDDIGQETFAQFFRSLGRFRGDSQIGTYITRIAINLSLNELKRRKRYARFFAEDLPEGVDVSASRRDQESAADIKRIVWDGLHELSPKFKSVIVLRLIDGYSTSETASLLNVAQGTVLSRLARAQAKLRQIIGDKLNDRS